MISTPLSDWRCSPKDVAANNTENHYHFENFSTDPYPANSAGKHFLENYRQLYFSIHGYASLTICTFGLIANILNIIVFAMRNMRSPINSIFMALAVSDMILLFSCIPITIHDFFLTESAKVNDYIHISGEWKIIRMGFLHVMVTSHAISAWLNVLVAFWSFVAVHSPARTIRCRCLVRARTAVILTYIACVVLCIPGYLNSFGSAHAYVKGVMKYDVLKYFDFWIFHIFLNILPCIFITSLTICLFAALCNASERRYGAGPKRGKIRDRMAQMLLAVILLFLVTHLPTGLTSFLAEVFRIDFLCYAVFNLKETMDCLALVNSAVKLMVYCAMSRRFHDTFVDLFVPRFRKANEQTVVVHNDGLGIPNEPGKYPFGFIIYFKG